MADRVRRPKKFEIFMKKIANKDGGESQIFETYKDCLVFCAALGAKRDRVEEFSETAEPIQLHIFSGDYDRALINALAIYKTDDHRMLGPEKEDDRIRIFEEYACGGLHVLESEIAHDAIDYEKQIVTLIAKEMRGRNIIDDISNISNEL